MKPTFITVSLLTSLSKTSSRKKVPASLRHLTWYKARNGLYAVKAETMEDLALVWNCKEIFIDVSGMYMYEEDEEMLIR